MNDEVIRRLKKWRNGEKTDPEKVQLYPTDRCNLNCIFCAQRNEDYGYKEELSHDRWIEVVKEISSMDVNRVLISGGGEPFCRPRTTLKIMEIVKDKNIKGRLITNGTLLDRETCGKIMDIGWDEVVFSVDAPSSKLHDRLRGSKGTFGKIVDSIETLRSLKGEKESRLAVNFVLMAKNYKELPEMIEFCDRMGIDSINFEPLTINNPRDRKLKLDKKQRKEMAEEIIPEAKKLEEDTGVETNLETLRNIKAEKAGDFKEEIEGKEISRNHGTFSDAPCYEPWLWPKIEANGDVWPCSTVPLETNVRNASFEEIWFGEKFDGLRKKILNGDLPQECENCVTTHLETNKRIRKKLEKHQS